MLLQDFEISKINYWSNYTVSIDDHVYDFIIINYTYLNIDLAFKFKRYKSLCFYELFLDYGETFTKSLDYMELLDQLKHNVPYLELSRNVEDIYDRLQT